MKKRILSILGLTALICLFASSAFADSAVFQTALAKSDTTFKVVKTIIFVIGGLGLVIFMTVLSVYIEAVCSDMRTNRYGPIPQGVAPNTRNNAFFIILAILFGSPAVAIFASGGLAGYSKAMFKHKLNATMDQTAMLVTNIRTMYGTQDSYAGLSAQTAYELGIISAQSYNPATQTIANPFGGKVMLTPLAVKKNYSNSGFAITYTGLPKEACIAMATADWGGTGFNSGFIGTSAGLGWHATADKVGAYNEGKAYSLQDALTDCSNNENDVTLYFY